MKSTAKVILRSLLVIAGIILFCWFLMPAFLTGSFHIGAVTGIAVSLLMIFYGVCCGWVNKLIRILWSRTTGKILLIALGAAAAAILILAVICMFCIGSARYKTPDRGRTVVVLGCRVYGSRPSAMLSARLRSALEYLEENPGSDVIVCGGCGTDETCAEAEVMYEWLKAEGISPERIYVEDRSLDTIDNLSNALEIIKEEGLNDSCVIVTNDYHVYRSLKYARRAGFEDPAGISAPTLWWMFPGVYVREMYGIMEMVFINHTGF